MATYRVPLKGKNIVNKEAARKVIDSLISKQVAVAKKAGIQAMQEIRLGSIDAWYRNNTDSSMKAATQSIVESVKQTKDEVLITITSYVDIDEYNRVKREKENGDGIYAWERKWKGSGIDWDYDTPADYLVYLQWNEGIRGLPEDAVHTKTGWHNDYFDQVTPMSQCVAESIVKNWTQTVNKYLQKG